MDPYQVCSNYHPGAKNCPAPGGHVLHRFMGRAVTNVGKTCGPTPCFVLAINTFKLNIGLYREKHGKISLSEIIMP